jgi:DHA2 family multidrug resistance protein
LLFLLFTWQMSRLDLDAGSADMSIPLVWRGVGLAIVTVPLSTLAISSLEPRDIPQGTALNNMMRQLGGSFGIAMVNTYLTRRNAVHRTDLVAHVSYGDPAFMARLDNYTRYFVNKGAVLADAQHQALGLVENAVMRQSSALSFGDAYLLLGGCFLVSLPLLLLTRRKKGARPQVALSEH